MGGDCPKDIQKAAEMYSNGQTVKPIVNNSKEQGGHLTNKGVDVNCGIYALKNAQIIYQNIINDNKKILLKMLKLGDFALLLKHKQQEMINFLKNM